MLISRKKANLRKDLISLLNKKGFSVAQQDLELSKNYSTDLDKF